MCKSGLDLQKLITNQENDWSFLININALSSALLSKLLYAKMNEDLPEEKNIPKYNSLISSPLFSNVKTSEDSETIEALVPYVMNAIRNHSDHNNFELTHRGNFRKKQFLESKSVKIHEIHRFLIKGIKLTAFLATILTKNIMKMQKNTNRI